MADHYEELGVGKDATPEEIKRAFRRKAAKHHPDRGGDTEKFQALSVACDVLTDPQRRAAYDATGEDLNALDRAKKVRAEVAGAFMAALEQIDEVERTNPLDSVRRFIFKAVTQNQSTIGRLKAKVKKLKLVAKRIKRKSSADDPIGQHLAGEIATTEAQIIFVGSQIELQNEMMALVEDYTYAMDPVERSPGAFSFLTSSTGTSNK